MDCTANFTANQSTFCPVVINRNREPATRNETAEQLLLACQLVEPKLIPIIAKLGIMPDDFCEFGHCEIQTALVNQWVRNRSIVAAELRADLIDTLGREVFPVLMLFQIVCEYVPASNWRYYCEQVSQASYSRLLERHNSEFSKAIRNRGNKPADIEELRQQNESERLAMVARLESVL